jgi:hypothetical protein
MPPDDLPSEKLQAGDLPVDYRPAEKLHPTTVGRRPTG